mgnify:CR=1 FL=1
MKKYEKPIIIKNEEPAEGVYAESGNCMYAEIRDMRYDGDGTMRFKVWYQHRASNDHCALGTYITLGFSTAVYLSDTSGYVAYDLTASTVTDQAAYDDAYNEYEYQTYLYEQKMNAINAQTSVIQAQDKKLELTLDQIETRHKAYETEIDSVAP